MIPGLCLGMYVMQLYTHMFVAHKMIWEIFSCWLKKDFDQ